MADVLIGQGLSALPGTGQGQVFWGQVRRAQYTLRGFTASTTTPFSGNTPAGILVYDSALAYAGTSGNTPGAEFDMDHVDGLQFIVSNDGSGQTLSGITLTDWDTLPSGVAVPGQSYTTATNVATGASVTLSSLSLATGQAVRLWVPIVAGSLRQWYVNPTYAAAVTSGTGGLEVRTIPTYGSVRLTGRNATGPTLLATLPYTDFTASANFRSAFSGKLSRSASRRTITLITTLDQPISDIKGLVVDSSAVSQAGIPAALTGVGLYVEFDFAGVIANTQYYEWNSDQYTALAGIGDSFIVNWTMGATAATSGNVYLFVTEQ